MVAMHKVLQTQEYLENPGRFIAQWRLQAPLVKSRIPLLGEVWFTTTQSAAAEILKDAKRFPVRKPDGKAVGDAWWMPRLISRLTNNMLSTDEPDHTRLRGIVDHAFQRRAVRELESEIDVIAMRYAAELKTGEVERDLVTAFARPFPLTVICELLGLPEADRPKFAKWAAGLTNVTGVFSFLAAAYQLRPLTRYIEQRIAHERQHGGKGLVHELVNETDEALSDDELVAMVFLLLLAGHETTTHLISGGAYFLLKHPDQLEKLRGEPELIDLAVEELLRFVSPVQMTKPRYVAEDCEIDGVALKRGELVMPMLIASNRDPAVFEEPEKLDISRKPNRHMEFGTGIHFCLGHQLARFEMKAALKHLFLEGSPIRLAVPASQVSWNQRLGLRSLKALPISAAAHDQQGSLLRD